MEFPLIRPAFSLPSPTSPSVAISSPSAASTEPAVVPKKRAAKSHVPAACVNCQKAHLACDLSRPCRRCVTSGKEGTCYDVQHKKRGRPKRRDQAAVGPVPALALSAPSAGAAAAGAAAVSHPPLSNRNLCVLPPELPRSSFLMTRPPGNDPADKDVDKPTVTVILSMDFCCARVSDESLSALGIYPHEFAHRSLYDFVPSSHAASLARVHRRLLDNAHNVSKSASKSSGFTASSVWTLPPTQRTTADCFASTAPSVLLCIANGSQTLKEDIAFKASSGREVNAKARFYLGGGLGSDLFAPDTLGKLYIVCLAVPESAHSPPSVASTSMEATNQSIISHHHRHNPHTPTQSLPAMSSPLFPTSSMQPSSSSFTPVLDPPSTLPFSMFHATTSDETHGSSSSTSVGDSDLVVQNQASHDYVSASPLHLHMSPPSIDISYSPASPPDAIPTTEDVDAHRSVPPQQQHPPSQPHQIPTASSSPASPLSASSTSSQQHDQAQLTSPLQHASAPTHHHKNPRVKPPQPEDCLLTATLDRQQERHARGPNTWSHPREAYFREIESSRLVSAEANAMAEFPYQSPSNAMMDALRHSTSPTGSSLNPVATHHRIPSIHTHIPPLRPFAPRHGP